MIWHVLPVVSNERLNMPLRHWDWREQRGLLSVLLELPGVCQSLGDCGDCGSLPYRSPDSQPRCVSLSLWDLLCLWVRRFVFFTVTERLSRFIFKLCANSTIFTLLTTHWPSQWNSLICAVFCIFWFSTDVLIKRKGFSGLQEYTAGTPSFSYCYDISLIPSYPVQR